MEYPLVNKLCPAQVGSDRARWGEGGGQEEVLIHGSCRTLDHGFGTMAPQRENPINSS